MKQSDTWIHLKEGTPFNDIFPDGRVPLRSIFPIIPRERNSPACYVVDASFLSDEQIQHLAQRLFELWQPECQSVEEAIAYIKKPGLPLKVDWFSTGPSTSSAGIFFTLMDEVDFKKEEEEFNDYDEDDEDY